MDETIRFGVAVLQNISFQELTRLWQTLDDSSLDSSWIADHFVNYASPTDPWYEAWTTLAGLAGFTSRIRIGTLVTSIPLRNPALLAREALTVDHISNGRLNLGMGAGAPGNVDPTYRMIGIENWPFKERIERFKEQVEIVDKVLQNKCTSYKGKYYHLDELMMAPEPIQKPRPPITVAAHTKSSLRIAAEYADSWNSYGSQFGAPPEVVVKKTEERIALLDRYCEELGRDPGSVRRSLLVFGSDANNAFASEEHFGEIVNRYTAIGINELIFYYPFFAPNQIPSFEEIIKEVVPKYRKL
jgi:alkanesulfonate monooxygenase SsuD/methylene tetrahydromethanopterin reductase-like flavin-dependent oxidoreductase (luciferase family)